MAWQSRRGEQEKQGTAVGVVKGLTGGEELIAPGVGLATAFALVGCIALCTPLERGREEMHC